MAGLFGLEEGIQQRGGGGMFGIKWNPIADVADIAKQATASVAASTVGVVHGITETGRGLINNDQETTNKGFTQALSSAANLGTGGVSGVIAQNQNAQNFLERGDVQGVTAGLSGDYAALNRASLIGSVTGQVSSADFNRIVQGGVKLGAVAGAGALYGAYGETAQGLGGLAVDNIAASSTYGSLVSGASSAGSAAAIAYGSTLIKGGTPEQAKDAALREIGLAPPGSVPTPSNPSNPLEFDPGWFGGTPSGSGASAKTDMTSILILGGIAVIAVIILARK